MYDDGQDKIFGIPKALKFRDVDTLPLAELRQRFSALAEFAGNLARPGELPVDLPHDFDALELDELRAILWKHHYWFPSLAETDKDIYRAVDAAAGEVALTTFEEGVWGKKYPAIGQSWRRAWSEVIPFYAFPADVRRILYTTDEIDKLFRRELLSWSGTGDRVAKSRGGGCKPDHAAFSVVPHLRHPCAVLHAAAATG